MVANIDAFIQHHGVKGMHWGVRRSRSAVTTAAPKPPKKKSADFKRIEAHRAKHPQELSNKQLKDLNERMNLEKNFKDLTNKVDQKKVDKGHDKVKYILGFATTATTAYAVAKSPLVKDVGKMFGGKSKGPQQLSFNLAKKAAKASKPKSVKKFW